MESTGEFDPGPGGMTTRYDKLLKSHGAQLSEHFDSVLILCTKKDDCDQGTGFYSHKSGNWYAMKASAEEWLEVEREKTKEDVRRQSRE